MKIGEGVLVYRSNPSEPIWSKEPLAQEEYNKILKEKK